MSTVSSGFHGPAFNESQCRKFQCLSCICRSNLGNGNKDPFDDMLNHFISTGEGYFKAWDLNVLVTQGRELLNACIKQANRKTSF